MTSWILIIKSICPALILDALVGVFSAVAATN